MEKDIGYKLIKSINLCFIYIQFFHFFFYYLQDIRLYLRVVAVNLLLHDIVSVRVPELVDDRNFPVGFHLFRYLCAVHDDAGMENLLVYLFPEIVCHAANECTLRKIGYLGSGYQGIKLRVDGSRSVLTVDGYGLPLLENLAEPFRQ